MEGQIGSKRRFQRKFIQQGYCGRFDDHMGKVDRVSLMSDEENYPETLGVVSNVTQDFRTATQARISLTKKRLQSRGENKQFALE